MSPVDLLIRPFDARDQEAARRLILEGLGEHFGSIDEARNPDLIDIAASYLAPGHVFVVAQIGARLVGTGALVAAGEGVGRIVRVTVSREHRRQGIGSALVEHLVQTARHCGMTHMQVETLKDWTDAIGLYHSCGFREYEQGDVDTRMALDLCR